MRPAPLPKPGKFTWICTTAQGIKAVHVRYVDKHGKKGYAWNHRNGVGLVKKLPPGVGRADLIYRTGSADETPLVIVAEGEKAADAVAIAFPAARVVGTPQGAPAAPTAEALAPALNGATTVVLWPDNDKNGHEQMKKVSALVREVAPGAAVHFVQVDDLPEKYDAADLGKQQRMARIQAAVNAPPVAFVAPVASVSLRGVASPKRRRYWRKAGLVASVAWHSRGNKIWGDEFELPILAPGEPFPDRGFAREICGRRQRACIRLSRRLCRYALLRCWALSL